MVLVVFCFSLPHVPLWAEVGCVVVSGCVFARWCGEAYVSAPLPSRYWFAISPDILVLLSQPRAMYLTANQTAKSRPQRVYSVDGICRARSTNRHAVALILRRRFTTRFPAGARHHRLGAERAGSASKPISTEASPPPPNSSIAALAGHWYVIPPPYLLAILLITEWQ